MSPATQGAIVLIVTLVVLLSGAPVAFGLGAIAISFLVIFQGLDSLHVAAETFYTGLSDFTLVTAEYHVAGLKGVIGVIGPTRMPYEKVVAIVDYTSRLVTDILRT